RAGPGGAGPGSARPCSARPGGGARAAGDDMIAAPGAVPVGALDPASPDAPVAAHYGDPMREQRQLATSVALVDRSHRGVLAIPGADRLGWLHSLTTQHVSDLAPMTGTELLVLSPHGHVEHHALLTEDGATSWLD